jgi:quercetin dioxygenase-like cupin family protein
MRSADVQSVQPCGAWRHQEHATIRLSVRHLRKGNMGDILKTSLLDLVAYQEGAVVSKTLIDKKTGTVTLFAFGEGQGLSEHTAPFDALVQVLDGEVEIRIAGQRFPLKAGEGIVMPANEPHELKAISRFKMMLTMIRP